MVAMNRGVTRCSGLVVATVMLTVGAGAEVLAAPGDAKAGKAPERLQYHPIRTDAGGKIVPWYSNDYGKAFDQVIRSTWKFWDTMAADRNGLPYHMNHQVWRPDLDDHRGIGGDQIQMALSSWALLNQYLGNVATDRHASKVAWFGRVVENMRFMADYYLTHGLSRPSDKWPNIPYPYNTFVYSGIYDGDMILGKNFTQPDKAGSLGFELVTLFKITGYVDYLDAAIAIADTLADKTRPGDNSNSPMPFKVNAVTGEVGKLFDSGNTVTRSAYTTNWSGTLRLFQELIAMRGADLNARFRQQGRPGERFSPKRVAAYRKAFDAILAWMKQFPLRTNKWGPFFEDVWGWSDTQINAVTFAEFIMDQRNLFPEWKKDVRGILDWVGHTLGNEEWKKYGVLAINEQTAYRVPGNSHTARQASAELRYAELSGDTAGKEMAFRQLAWATYMVDVDGTNLYPRNDVWMTDGYGDYVRHYLRAMAAAPEIAPSDQDHILRSTSVMSAIRYFPDMIRYQTYDRGATEILRVTRKPKTILLGEGGVEKLAEAADLAAGPGWHFAPLKTGGLLTVRHDDKANVTIQF